MAIPAFAGAPTSEREYAERCADYYAHQYGVSPALVRAVIQIESSWQPGLVSPKGALGLMQLMPATAHRFGVAHPFYIHENVRGGVAYLAKLQESFHGDLRLVMAAYAAGEAPVLARGLDYSSQEVYSYVQRIGQQYRAELRQKERKEYAPFEGLHLHPEFARRRVRTNARAPNARSGDPNPRQP
jgi:soluble lytic murein transglycosylase-like protein